MSDNEDSNEGLDAKKSESETVRVNVTHREKVAYAGLCRDLEVKI